MKLLLAGLALAGGALWSAYRNHQDHRNQDFLSKIVYAWFVVVGLVLMAAGFSA